MGEWARRWQKFVSWRFLEFYDKSYITSRFFLLSSWRKVPLVKTVSKRSILSKNRPFVQDLWANGLTDNQNYNIDGFLEIYAKFDITAHSFQVGGGSLSRNGLTDESSVMTPWQLHTFKLSHLPRHHLKETLSIGHLNPWFVARDHPQLIDGGRDSGRRQKAWNCESSVICQSSHLLPSRPNAYHQSEAWNNEPLRRLTNIPVVFSTKASDCIDFVNT